MWQAPSQRGKAITAAKKRELMRRRFPIHIKRAHAQLKIVSGSTSEAAPLEVRLILNDLSPGGVGIFSVTALTPGQDVVIVLEQPRMKEVKGQVIWCQEHDSSTHVLSKARYTYRCGIKFLYDSAEKQEEMKKYCEEVMNDYIHGLKVA